MAKTHRLLLVGGGHAHLEVLHALARERRRDVSLTVVSTPPRQHVASMLAGFVRGTFEEDDLTVDLAALTARAGGRFVEGRAAVFAPSRKTVELAIGAALSYDLVSFAVGCDARGNRLREVREHALALKPASRVAFVRRRLLELVQAGPGAGARVVVVGGGAAGFEMACAAAGVLDDARRPRRVVVVEATPRLLSSHSARVGDKALAVLRSKKIDVRFGRGVTSLEAGAVVLSNGQKLPSDLTLWTTGPEPTELFRDSGLPLDKRGFLMVDDSLRSVSDTTVFAAGECATLAAAPGTVRSAALAVRQGPVLHQALLAALDGRALPRFTPPSDVTSILDTGDGRALLCRGPLLSWGRWAWLVKERLDRAYMRRFQA